MGNMCNNTGLDSSIEARQIEINDSIIRERIGILLSVNQPKEEVPFKAQFWSDPWSQYEPPLQLRLPHKNRRLTN